MEKYIAGLPGPSTPLKASEIRENLDALNRRTNALDVSVLPDSATLDVNSGTVYFGSARPAFVPRTFINLRDPLLEGIGSSFTSSQRFHYKRVLLYLINPATTGFIPTLRVKSVSASSSTREGLTGSDQTPLAGVDQLPICYITVKNNGVTGSGSRFAIDNLTVSDIEDIRPFIIIPTTSTSTQEQLTINNSLTIGNSSENDGSLTVNGGLTVSGATTLQDGEFESFSGTSLSLADLTVTNSLDIANVLIDSMVVNNAEISDLIVSDTFNLTGQLTTEDLIVNNALTANEVTSNDLSIGRNLNLPGIITIGDGINTFGDNEDLTGNDDSVIFNNATIIMDGNNVLKIKAGEYTLTEDLVFDSQFTDCIVEGLGNKTVIKTNGWQIIFNQCNGLVLRNLTIQVSGSSDGYGVATYGVTASSAPIQLGVANNTYMVTIDQVRFEVDTVTEPFDSSASPNYPRFINITNYLRGLSLVSCLFEKDSGTSTVAPTRSGTLDYVRIANSFAKGSLVNTTEEPKYSGYAFISHLG